MGAMVQKTQRVKLCECGCGEAAPIAKETNSKRGYSKGSPMRFVRGHHIRTLEYQARVVDAPERVTKMGLAKRKNPARIDYTALHKWLRLNFEKSGECEECGETKTTEWSLIAGRQYSRERSDYRELCRSCHRTYDALWSPRQIARWLT